MAIAIAGKASASVTRNFRSKKAIVEISGESLVELKMFLQLKNQIVNIFINQAQRCIFLAPPVRREDNASNREMQKSLPGNGTSLIYIAMATPVFMSSMAG